MSTSSSNPEQGSFAQEARTQTLKAVVLIVVAVLVAVLLLHRTASTGGVPVTSKKPASSATTAPQATTPTTAPTTIPPAQVKVLVLNGTLKGSLAGELTTKVKGAGYTTVTPDNTTSAVTTSTVYAVTSQYTVEAQALATALGLPATDVVTNLPATAPIAHSEQTEANVVIVIGPDLATKVATLTLPGSTTATTTAG